MVLASATAVAWVGPPMVTVTVCPQACALMGALGCATSCTSSARPWRVALVTFARCHVSYLVLATPLPGCAEELCCTDTATMSPRLAGYSSRVARFNWLVVLAFMCVGPSIRQLRVGAQQLVRAGSVLDGSARQVAVLADAGDVQSGRLVEIGARLREAHVAGVLRGADAVADVGHVCRLLVGPATPPGARFSMAN